MKKHLFIAALLASAVAVSATQASVALPVTDPLARATSETANKTEAETETTSELATTDKVDVAAKRQALEQKMVERKAAIAEKLSGQRQEKCKKREVTINTVLDHRAAAAQRYFDNFSAIQEKLVTFVAEKQLDVHNANALLLVMNDSANDAQAAIQAIESTDFTCEAASAAAPGALVKDQIATAKQALKDYRTAIKDYVVAVKSTVEQQSKTETVIEEAN